MRHFKVLMRDLRSSLRWRFRSWPSAMWRHVVMWYNTSRAAPPLHRGFWCEICGFHCIKIQIITQKTRTWILSIFTCLTFGFILVNKKPWSQAYEVFYGSTSKTYLHILNGTLYTGPCPLRYTNSGVVTLKNPPGKINIVEMCTTGNYEQKSFAKLYNYWFTIPAKLTLEHVEERRSHALFGKLRINFYNKFQDLTLILPLIGIYHIRHIGVINDRKLKTEKCVKF